MLCYQTQSEVSNHKQHQRPAGRPEPQQPLDPELIPPDPEPHVNQCIHIVAVTKTACPLTPTRVHTHTMSALSLALKHVGVAAHHTSADRRIQVPVSTAHRALGTNGLFSLFLGIPTGMNVQLCYFSRSGQLAHVVHSLIKASLENWPVVRLVLWPV